MESREADRLQVQARVVDDNLLRQLVGVDAALSGMRDEIQALRPGADLARLGVRLKLLAQAMPGVRTLLVLDAQGTVAATSRDELLGRDVHGYGFFADMRPDARPGVLYVSRPFKSPFGGLVVNLTRVLQKPDGAFDGVVTATLDPDYFSVVLGSVLYAPDMRATLVHGEGRVFMSMPMVPGALNLDVSRAGTLFARHRDSGREAGLLVGRVATSGDLRMAAARTVSSAALGMDQPIVAFVSRDLDALYRPWRQRVTEFGVFWLLVVAVCASALFAMQRRRVAFDALAAEAGQRIARSEERLSLALEGSGLALFDWDVRADRHYESAQMALLRGAEPRERVVTTAEFLAEVHPEDRPALKEAMDEIHAVDAEDKPPRSVEYRVQRVDGEWIWLRSSGRVVERDDQGRALRLSGTVGDIHQLKLAEARLRQMAEYDALTGVPNRALFNDRLRQALLRAHRANRPMALLFVDVDHFKPINDSLGHEAGDELLKTFAGRLQAAVRKSDTVARLGGDEFTVIVEQLNAEVDACLLAAKLVEAARLPMVLRAGTARVSASIGIAMSRPGEDDAATLLRRADAALYQAKREGRDRFAMAG